MTWDNISGLVLNIGKGLFNCILNVLSTIFLKIYTKYVPSINNSSLSEGYGNLTLLMFSNNNNICVCRDGSALRAPEFCWQLSIMPAPGDPMTLTSKDTHAHIHVPTGRHRHTYT